MPAPTPLSNVDAAWLRMEHPTNLMMITGVMMLGETVPLERLQDVIGGRLLGYDRFRRRVEGGLGSPKWTDDPYFDINEHVQRVALPEPGGKAALESFVSDLMSQPLDPAKPLWHFYLVENYDGGAAVVGRVHHAVGDGLALMHVLLSLATATPEGDPIGSAPPARIPRPKRGGILGAALRPVRSVVRGVGKVTGAALGESFEIVTNPKHLFKRAQQGLDYTASLTRLALRGSDSDTRFRGALGLRKRAAWSAPIPLEDVKAVGQATGTTINDVLMATLAGALRSYLLSHGDAAEGTEMRAVIPVNLRAPERAHELGNEFGLVFLALPVYIADPVERLRETQVRMDKLKGSMEAIAAYTILGVVGVAPEEVRGQIIKMFSAMGSTVLTNVPGPREQLYIAGAPMTDIMFWVPRAGSISTGLSILSYNGNVTVGIATDAGLVPDPEAIASAYHAEFAALQAAVDG